MYNNGFQSYKKTNVVTADPKKLVLMCYEGAIDNLKIAKEKYAQKDFEGKCNVINKTQDIINEMQCSLDFEKGGKIAENLNSLYNYMIKQILSADINQNMDTLDEVIGILSDLKSAWEQIFYRQNYKTSDIKAVG